MSKNFLAIIVTVVLTLACLILGSFTASSPLRSIVKNAIITQAFFDPRDFDKWYQAVPNSAKDDPNFGQGISYYFLPVKNYPVQPLTFYFKNSQIQLADKDLGF